VKLSNLSIPFDAYERNKKIASSLHANQTVLDVGGGITGIKLFSQNKITIVDLEVGDIRMDARKLKLKPGSFDVVVSVDVLEHLPLKDRKKFVESLTKIAKDKVIISAPFGSKKHLEAEKKLLKEIKSKGRKDFFLEQHVKYVLPKPEDVINISNKAVKTYYSGDFRINDYLFWLSHLETGNPIIDRLLLVYKRIVNLSLNLLYYPFLFVDNPKKHTNRFYLVITK